LRYPYAFNDSKSADKISISGLILNPLVGRIWSLIGQTPVVGDDGGHRKKVLVIGAVSMSSVTRRLGFYFATEVNLAANL
jgi:hypothetical protein